MMVDCVDPNHFYILDGAIYAQPWMQERRVATAEVKAKSGSYGVSGSQNKNDVLQTAATEWENDTPLAAWVYGEVTVGSTKVTLQARSRGWIAQWHGCTTVQGPITLTEASRTGVGLDVGRGGVLGTGTDMGIAENREYSSTIPLCPMKAGWVRVAPGDTFFAKAETRFTTAFWEGSDPDGGAPGTESTYEVGAMRLDLFAVPIIE